MEPVAIVGLACRFPGAPDADRFWELLAQGRCAVREVPAERWDAGRFYSSDPAEPGRSNSRWGGFLDDVEGFDAGFFGLSPREADAMDPQQRLLLEVGAEAFEDAGLTMERLRGSRTGVFVGVMYNDHGSRLMEGDPRHVDAFSGTGNILSVVANRVSYVLDLRGPSLVVDTACSSSLVALHQACASLRTGDCDTALVGGVNVMLSPAQYVFFTKAGLTSPEGLCKAFDAGADGIVRGEGCGAVVLKPLSRARADGDRVLAVIRGSAINHNGRSNGLGAPSPPGQEALLRAAYAAAGVAPSQVQYVEAHGTGTVLGDAGEARALGAVVGRGRKAEDACRIGSVKSNLGHLEAAAGMAGLVKVCLSLARRQLPPTLHVREPNPKIPFESLGLSVQRHLDPWPGEPACAGLSAFGLGGCNVHVVLEGERDRRAHGPIRRHEKAAATAPRLLLLSARSEEALRALAERTQSWLASEGATGPAAPEDVAHSAARRRSHHAHRLALPGDGIAAWRSGLAAFLDGDAGGAVQAGCRPRHARTPVVFLFSGQGSPWWDAAGALLREEPAFARRFAALDAELAPRLGCSVAALLHGRGADAHLASTRFGQPLLFALQVALAELWREWGIEPDAVLGHSVGEVAAAVVAGALTPSDAAILLRARGELMESAPPGCMWSVRLPADEARALLVASDSRAAVAAENGPGSVVLAGSARELEALRPALARAHATVRELPMNRAFHGIDMMPLAAPLRNALAGLRPGPAHCSFVSSCAGRELDGQVLGAGYWARQLVRPVRFQAAVEWLFEEALRDDAPAVFLELGPPVLGAAVRRCARGRGRDALVAASATKQGLPTATAHESAAAATHGSARAALLHAAATLYCAGRDLAWDRVVTDGRYVPLPVYPWQRRRHRAAFAGPRPLPATSEPLEGRAAPARLGRGSPSWLYDHRVMGRILVPGVAYLDAVLAALAPGDGEAVALDDVRFHQTLFLDEHDEIELRPRLFDREGVRHFEVESAACGSDARTLRASGRIGAADVAGLDSDSCGVETADAIRARCPREVSAQEFYAALDRHGFAYGPRMRGVRRLWVGEQEALAELELPVTERGALADHRVHPSLFDATAHTLFATFLLTEGPGDGEQWLPQGARRVVYRSSPPERLFVHARLRPGSSEDGERLGELRAMDASGAVYLECHGGRVQRVGRAASGAATPPADLYRVDWEALAPVQQRAAHEIRTWILLADTGGVAEALAERVRARGDTVHLLHLATAGPGPGESVCDEASLRRALRELDRSAGANRHVVLLWSADPQRSWSPEALAESQRAGCAAALALLQETLARGQAGSHLWLVTRGAVDTGAPSERVDGLFQSPLWGLGRALEREHAEIFGGLVDLDPESADAGEALLGHIDACELPDPERQVAFRAGERLAPRLTALAGPAANAAPLRCREDARYLITGGLGDLGLRVAADLAARGARSLLLVGRTPLPPPERWDDPTLDERTAARVARVRALRESGVTVATAAVDVADAVAFDRWLEALRNDGGPPLRGVVHAAGVAVGGLAEQLDTRGLESVLAPKVSAAWALHRAFPERELDFFVLFSSAASLLGVLGQGLASYAAANAFLDALAAHRSRRGAPAVSIGWGAWAEIGLYARSGRQHNAAERGLGAMSPEDALARLAQIATSPDAHLAVLPMDWSRFRTAYGAAARSPFLARVIPREAPPTQPVPLGDALHAPAFDEADLVARLQTTVAEILGYSADAVDPALPLSDLGSDSIMAVELRETIEVELGVALPIRSFLEDPSLIQLARAVQGARAAMAVATPLTASAGAA